MSNRKYAEAMQGLRKSNAATKHDPRPRKQRTRRDEKRAAIRDQGRHGTNWT